MAAVGPLAAGDPARYAALAAGLALLVGGVCSLGGLLRAGALADLLARPVLIGYMAGIAVIMIVGQLGRVTGVPVEGTSPVEQVASFAARLGQAHLATLALAAVLLVGLLVGAWLRPRWPVPMIGMLAAAAVVAAFALDGRGVAVVGSAGAGGLPVPGVPALAASDLTALLLPALGVAIVGYSDNVLTARAFATRRGEAIRGTPELVALGAAIAAGLVRGFPVSSSGSRTAIGDAQAAAPSCTRWSHWCWWRSSSWRAGDCWPGSRGRRSAQW